MKISIEIECTPDEARAAMGLPDASAVNEVMLEQLKQHMEKGLSEEFLNSVMTSWAEGAQKGMAEMQNMFWSALKPGDKS